MIGETPCGANGMLGAVARHDEAPLKDWDLLSGRPTGTIPGTTRTTFSGESTYTASEHRVVKRPCVASLDLKGGLPIEQGGTDLDGHRDLIRELQSDGAKVRWLRLHPGGPFEKLTTREVLACDGDFAPYQLTEWTDADGDAAEKTFRMSNVSH